MWLKILKSLWTPLWFPLDKKYLTVTEAELKQMYLDIPKMKYVADTYDCDDFAFVFKGSAAFRTNAVGIVIGWHKGMHCWNCANLKDRLIQIEPQNGLVFKHKKNYIPFMVIM
jgi:hypothetical protein